jgi:hypothetical protein
MPYTPRQARATERTRRITYLGLHHHNLGVLSHLRNKAAVARPLVLLYVADVASELRSAHLFSSSRRSSTSHYHHHDVPRSRDTVTRNPQTDGLRS